MPLNGWERRGPSDARRPARQPGRGAEGARGRTVPSTARAKRLPAGLPDLRGISIPRRPPCRRHRGTRTASRRSTLPITGHDGAASRAQSASCPSVMNEMAHAAGWWSAARAQRARSLALNPCSSTGCSSRLTPFRARRTPSLNATAVAVPSPLSVTRNRNRSSSILSVSPGATCSKSSEWGSGTSPCDAASSANVMRSPLATGRSAMCPRRIFAPWRSMMRRIEGDSWRMRLRASRTSSIAACDVLIRRAVAPASTNARAESQDAGPSVATSSKRGER